MSNKLNKIEGLSADEAACGCRGQNEVVCIILKSTLKKKSNLRKQIKSEEKKSNLKKKSQKNSEISFFEKKISKGGGFRTPLTPPGSASGV